MFPATSGFLVSFEAAPAAFPRHSRAHSLVHWVAQIVEGTTEKRMEARSFSPRSCSGTYEGSGCADGQVFVRLLASVVVPTKEVCCSDAPLEH